MLYEKLRLRIRNAIRYIGESDLFQFYGENESNGNFSKLVCLTERRIWIYRDAVKSESCGVVHTVQLNYDLGGEIE